MDAGQANKTTEKLAAGACVSSQSRLMDYLAKCPAHENQH
jgi:hypothetical protein